MIILSRSEIEALVDYRQAAVAIEDAYRAVSQGAVTLPPVGYLQLPDVGGDCHIKYGHIEGDDYFVIKVATGFPGNEALGLANGDGAVLVLSARTGKVDAILHDNMVLTDIRTGLGGAVASRLLSRKASRTITILGSGVQARRQVQAHRALMGQDLVFQLWARSTVKAQKTVAELSGSVDIDAVSSLENACGSADIIVTTTATTTPIVQRDWVTPGTHITAVGADAPGKQELETSLVASADALYCDLKSQCLDHGELAIPWADGHVDQETVTEVGDVLIDCTKGRQSDHQITICDLTGLAVQDIAMANVILDNHGSRAPRPSEPDKDPC